MDTIKFTATCEECGHECEQELYNTTMNDAVTFEFRCCDCGCLLRDGAFEVIKEIDLPFSGSEPKSI